MLKAKDFRRYAREALAGRWLKAGFVGLVASLLGGTIGRFTSSGSLGSSTETGALGENAAALLESDAVVLAGVMGVALVVLLWAIVILIIGGATTLGYAKYNLNLVDDQNPKIGDLFSQYDRLGTGFGMQILRGLYTFLWSLLFVIPGIIAGYRYYMTPFILCENPEMTASEAIRESKELMKGNKWRLFCLELSFYGWIILAAVLLGAMMMVASVPMMIMSGDVDATSTMITGVVITIIVSIVFVIAVSLVLMPYINASIAVFYREISEERYSAPQGEAEPVDYVYETVPEKDSDDIIEYIEF